MTIKVSGEGRSKWTTIVEESESYLDRLRKLMPLLRSRFADSSLEKLELVVNEKDETIGVLINGNLWSVDEIEMVPEDPVQEIIAILAGI